MSDKDIELPDLPAFDSGALRRAVRRGVLRTAFVGGLWVLVALFVLGMLGSVTVKLLGRSDHLKNVVVAGWEVAHPEYLPQETAANVSATSASVRLVVRQLGVSETGGTTTLSFREGIFGGVPSVLPEPKSAASQVLQGIDPRDVNDTTRAGERTFLSQLPKSVAVAAVIQFRAGMSFADYRGFMTANQRSFELDGAPVLFSETADTMQGIHLIRGVYGWSAHQDPATFGASPGDELTEFRKWVHTLHDSDRSALATVGVDLNAVRAAANAGLVYGVIVHRASPDYLLRLLANPAVAAVHPYDAQFAIEGG